MLMKSIYIIRTCVSLFQCFSSFGHLDTKRENCSQTSNNPPKGVIISDFMLTFAMSLKIFLLVLKRSTKVSEKSDMAKSWATFCCSGTYKQS